MSRNVIRAEKIFRDKRAAAEKSRRYEVRVALTDAERDYFMREYNARVDAYTADVLTRGYNHE